MPKKFDVRITQIVTKQLKCLSRGGGNAASAAEHARAIMAHVFDGTVSLKESGRLTRYGEARIPNCIKFDLARGYRLIAVVVARDITFLFVGKHNECEHWIKNNAGVSFRLDCIKAAELHLNTDKEEERSFVPDEREEYGETDCDEETDFGVDILNSLSDRDLRKIFGGICRHNL